jgi:anti-sigma factor ChrR (cupin superfamily)
MDETIINSHKMEWQDAGGGYPAGTKMKLLHDDDDGRTAIIQLPEGFVMQAHSHIKNEQHYVLKGQYEIGKTVYSQGTYQFIHPSITHGPFTSQTGAEILVVWY